MALEAKRAHVGQIALAASLGYGDDVVRIPERFSAAHAPCSHRFCARGAAQLFHAPQFCDAIDSALGADAAIALKDSIAQMAGITAQLPFLDAPIRAER